MPRERNNQPCTEPTSSTSGVQFTDHEVRSLRDLFSALAAETRVRIVLALIFTPEDLNVTELAHRVGMSASVVSSHLRSLRILGWVERQKHGKESVYRVTDPCMENIVRCGILAIRPES